MDIIEQVTSNLGIPRSYMKKTAKKDRVVIAVHQTWIRLLLRSRQIPEFISHEYLTEEEVKAWLHQDEDLGSSWQLLFVKILKKEQRKVIPLPRVRSSTAKAEPILSFTQLLHYVSQTNHKNLWKDAFKKYLGSNMPNVPKSNVHIHLTDYDAVLREIILRTFGCPLISLNVQDGEDAADGKKTKQHEVHCNILSAICALETSSCFLLLHQPYIPYTLRDCVTFSPAVFDTSHVKPLFIIYQLLQAMRAMHDRGLVLGDISLEDIFIRDGMWVQIIPQIEDNIHDVPKTEATKEHSIVWDQKMDDEVVNSTCTTAANNPEMSSCKNNSSTHSKSTTCDSAQNRSQKSLQDIRSNYMRSLGVLHWSHRISTNRLDAHKAKGDEGPDINNLEQLCIMWVYGQLSNFDYLTALNRLAGRQYGHPSCHHIMPWVTDFSSRSGANWRDLSRSKFRLNKGDRQLDLTYDTATGTAQIPHHVSDVLSEITYYVYLARRTPRSVLCKYVRTNWVPAEYPSSIQRLQEWTPDECIPEFFTDPSVFESIHDDLPNLEIPIWAASPLDFVQKHREALESSHVSERLHHWIDLTFGYKLSGSAAVKSKNVCLQLVDSHTSLTNRGVVQLFSQPHPQKYSPSPFWGKTPPKLHPSACSKKRACDRASEDEGHSSGFEEEETVQAQSRASSLALSRLLSRSRGSLQVPHSGEPEVGNKDREQQKAIPSITLPKEFNPASALQALEQLHSFLNKIFLHNHSLLLPSIPPQDTATSQGYKQVVATRRIREMQVLGCLVMELFLASKLRAFSPVTFEQRLMTCTCLLGDLPSCVRKAEELLLQRDTATFCYPAVTSQGLPPPSAYQLLQPLLSSVIFPFPSYFPHLYSVLCTFQEYVTIITELILLCDDKNEAALFLNKIGEIKVKIAARELITLLPEMLSVSPESIDLILPYVKDLLEDSFTSVSAAWHLFDPVARVLGPQRTATELLDLIAKLYDYSISAKLYHRSFLLQLIIRLGLKCFLDNFVAPLVEGVGGYRDMGPSQQNHQQQCKTSHLKNCDLEETPHENEGILSPLEEDSDSEHNKHEEDIPNSEQEPEVFVFEAEENGKSSPPTENELPLYNLMDHLDLNLLPAEDNSSLEMHSDDMDDLEELPQNKSASFTRGQGSMQKDENKAEKLTAHCKVSDMSVDSVIWLAHRLGPVLTARHLSRNLLRMLSLCYLGRENLTPLSSGVASNISDAPLISITKGFVLGDHNALNVLECLASIAALYGEQFILLQYLPHMGELIALCKRKLTLNLEGGLVGCLALLKHLIPYLCDATLMDQLQDVILKSILHPAIRLISTTKFTFPSGTVARAAVTAKFLDAVYVMALRIGCEMTRRHLAVPSLQRFFLTFDKAFGRPNIQNVENIGKSEKGSPYRSVEEGTYLEAQPDSALLDRAAKGMPLQISHVRVLDGDSADSFSPPPLIGSEGEQPQEQQQNKTVEELKEVFTAELAHQAYLPFCRFLGESVMEASLKNHDFIRELCYKHECSPGESPLDVLYLSEYLSAGTYNDEEPSQGCGSFGSNVAVVGNRIDLQRSDVSSLQPNAQVSDGDVMSLISRKMENTNRHLHGNWLAYWEHEIGRAEKDTHFNFKQIKLQSFSGHNNGVRAILALDNENSFLSGSRDKTVKLWSLRSQGDGSTVSQCQWTYSGHRKTVLAITFLESLRLVASCDSVVHLWDPFMGCVVAQLDSLRIPPITVLRAMLPPSTTIMAATADATLRLLDARTCSFVNELKVSVNPAGLIRCIAVSPSGRWIAVGQSSGYLTILDIRTGMILASWKGHEGEVLQLVAASDSTIVSSSLDQTVSVWNTTDGKFSFHMKGPTEPVHCLSAYNSELIWGTTANRIGVHTAIDAHASSSSTRLRSDTFKGVLTSMAVLPLNRLLLLGADTGNIGLLC